MGKISDLTLEQFHLGELPARQERLVRQELERDAELRGRLAVIARSDNEIRSAYPAESIVPLIRERALREGAVAQRRIPTLAWAIPVAAMALVLISLPVILRPSDQTRLKGIAPHLLVFRKTTAGAEELAQGALARKGDVLQLSYVAGEAKYGVIFSVDGRGTLTWHSPVGYSGGSRTAPSLDLKGPVLLSTAYELDDAPGFERFYLVYSSRSFDIGNVDGAARALARQVSAAGPGAAVAGPLSLPQGLGQFSVLVRKQG